jgi:hypothetical protein
MAELDAARGQIEVDALVWIEVDADPGQYLQDASYVAGLTERDPRIKGMVAPAPLERGARQLLEYRGAKPVHTIAQSPSTASNRPIENR